MKDFITRHPRLTYLLVGLFAGILTGALVFLQAKDTIDRLERSIERELEIHSEYIEKTSSTITSLRNENKKLKSKTRTYKLVKPDGTIEERTSSDIESEESVTESIKEEYRKEYEEKLSRREKEIRKEVQESKKLIITGGVTDSLTFYGGASYTILPPLVIHGFGSGDGSFGVGIGIRL